MRCVRRCARICIAIESSESKVLSVRLVLVGPVYPFRGGIAHYTTVLYQEMLKAGHEVLLISFRRQYPHWLFPGRSDRDPSVRAVKADHARYLLDPLNPLSWLRAFLEINSYQAQTVVLQWWHTFWAPAWLVLGGLVRLCGRASTVIICHNVLPHEQHPWDRFLVRFVLKMAHRVIVQSTSEREALLGLVPQANARVVPHPLYDMFARGEMSREAARQRLGIAPEASVLLFFGFVRDYKGLDVLIEALPAVRKVFPDVLLVIAGEFWQDRRNYEQRIEALGLKDHILIVDRYIPNEEVEIYFKAADLVTLPYTTATQSGVLQLALGFGIPVVSTRVGGLSEAVEEGKGVILVDPRNSVALADAIISFLHSPPPASLLSTSQENSRRRWASLVSVVTGEND